MDWRLFGSGIAMIAVGSIIGLLYWSVLTTGSLEEFNPARGFIQIGTIIASLGVLLTLVSFDLGRGRRRRGGVGTATQKPSDSA